MRRRPIVAIVGRPNVGKSTLFNRIIHERKALVHDQPGMTRDRLYAQTDYRGRPFTLIDTGGYEDQTDSLILRQMREQVLYAIEEADAVIFLTDVNEPDDPADAEIISRLRASGKAFHLAVNKCDKPSDEAQAIADFSRFGIDPIFAISGLNGDGVFDLLDAVTDCMDEWDPDDELDNGNIRVALVGRQNVGKSTLLNRLFGGDRVIVSPEAGTTRDAIDADVTVGGKPYTIIDTAGIRRRGRIEKGPEALSVFSSFNAIDRAHVCLMVVDASEGIVAQDLHVGGYIQDSKRACIIVLNKWDLVKEREASFKKWVKDVRREFNFLPWAPILTVSAKTGQRTHRIWDLIQLCAENFQKKFRTADLNVILKKATAHVSVPARRGNAVTIKYVTQTGQRPPVLTFFVNKPELVHFSYRRYLQNQFYQQLGLEGTPLVFRMRAKSEERGWERNWNKVRPGGAEADIEASTDAQPIAEEQEQAWYAKNYRDDAEDFAQEVSLDYIEGDDEPV